MMTVQQLNRAQLDELKQAYISDRFDDCGECPSWGDLAEAPDTVSDATIFLYYAGVVFSPDDFCA